MAKKTIGLIVSSMDSETTIELYRGIRDAAAKCDYSTQGFVIYPSIDSTALYNQGEFYIFETMDFPKYDGLVVALNTISDLRVREKLRKRISNAEIPMISIDCELANSISIDNDNYHSVRRQFELLVDKYNCSNINYISGPRNNEESNERLKAYLDCMSEHGFSSKGRVYEGTFYVNDGKGALDYFDNNFNGKNYDAIMCGNDMMAISTYVELTKRGAKVPDDVVITGYDNISEVETMPIISIKRDNYAIGKKAIELLKACFDGEKPDKKQFVPAIITNEDVKSGFIPNNIGGREYDSFVTYKSMHAITRGYVEESTQCKDFQEYLRVLKKFIFRINPEFFQLNIFGEYAELFELQDYSFIPYRDPDGNRMDIISVLEYDNEHFIDETKDGTGEAFDMMILETMKVDGEINQDEMFKTMTKMTPARQTLNTPLHFLENTFGYVSFAGTEFPLIAGVYWDWIVSLNYTLNNMYNMLTTQQFFLTDAVTGLYNRMGLAHYAPRFCERSKSKREDLTFFFFDLNGLKKINDNYGHESGDLAIQTVGEVILEYTSRKVKGFRYGGDEFLMIGAGIEEYEIEGIAEEMAMKITENAKKHNFEFTVSASIGYSTRKWSSEEKIEEAITRADKMMYAKKLER